MRLILSLWGACKRGAEGVCSAAESYQQDFVKGEN